MTYSSNEKPDQDQINRAIMAYETARMSARPKPKFILEIKDSHFYAKPSRGTLWDVAIVAATGAAWFGLLFSLWVIFA
jgi:hypothetical protein